MLVLFSPLLNHSMLLYLNRINCVDISNPIVILFANFSFLYITRHHSKCTFSLALQFDLVFYLFYTLIVHGVFMEILSHTFCHMKKREKSDITYFLSNFIAINPIYMEEFKWKENKIKMLRFFYTSIYKARLQQ